MTQTINGTEYATMEDGGIIVVSAHVEIHCDDRGFTVVRNGSIYGTYESIEFAEDVAKDL